MNYQIYKVENDNFNYVSCTTSQRIAEAVRNLQYRKDMPENLQNIVYDNNKRIYWLKTIQVDNIADAYIEINKICKNYKNNINEEVDIVKKKKKKSRTESFITCPICGKEYNKYYYKKYHYHKYLMA